MSNKKTQGRSYQSEPVIPSKPTCSGLAIKLQLTAKAEQDDELALCSGKQEISTPTSCLPDCINLATVLPNTYVAHGQNGDVSFPQILQVLCKYSCNVNKEI
ncbi:hypothetical protein CHS0354_017645 [Potamilus streckersoni]|uniref:Uncharacterized protein n=1 Tax=Potamilus streckersoni TaxID=2493646 RepID=A0AAE0W5H5_9BIVA|nr:hypothetical protein CHS0354_017645 [Potamilus streckersoni]